MKVKPPYGAFKIRGEDIINLVVDRAPKKSAEYQNRKH